MSTNETDISPDSGEETDEGRDVQAIGENLFENQNWQILKLKTTLYPFSKILSLLAWTQKGYFLMDD